MPEIMQSARNSAATISIGTTSLRPRLNPTGIPDRPGPARRAKFVGRIADHSTRLNRDRLKTNARRQSQGSVTLAAVLSSRVVRANRCRLLLAVASLQRRARGPQRHFVLGYVAHYPTTIHARPSICAYYSPKKTHLPAPPAPPRAIGSNQACQKVNALILKVKLVSSAQFYTSLSAAPQCTILHISAQFHALGTRGSLPAAGHPPQVRLPAETTLPTP